MDEKIYIGPYLTVDRDIGSKPTDNFQLCCTNKDCVKYNVSSRGKFCNECAGELSQVNLFQDKQINTEELMEIIGTPEFLFQPEQPIVGNKRVMLCNFPKYFLSTTNKKIEHFDFDEIDKEGMMEKFLNSPETIKIFEHFKGKRLEYEVRFGMVKYIL